MNRHDQTNNGAGIPASSTRANDVREWLSTREIWTTAQLNTIGLDSRSINRVVEERFLHRVERGVYVRAPADDHLLLRALARNRPSLVYSGPTAAHLYGHGPMEWPAQGRVAKGTSTMGNDLLTLSETRVKAFRTIGDLRVTTPAATAAAMPAMSDGQIITFLAREYRGIGGNDLLARDLAAMGKTDRRRIGALARRAPAGAASSYERTLQEGLAARGIDAELNRRIGPYTWDAVIADGRTVVDIDSWAFHAAQGAHASDRTFIVDRWKTNDAFRRGWAPLRYTDSCIMFALKAVLDQIADTVAFRRAHRRLRTPNELRSDDQPVWDWHQSL